jgi:pyruvate/2-oxoglutarate dehydrogenase complex dihydrolipoamide dehydrogenase (E3) component
MKVKKENCYDLIVLGGGAGGLSTAAGAARLGIRTMLIERGRLGGDCLWVGCVPSKTLLHEADKMRDMREMFIGSSKGAGELMKDFDKNEYFKIALKRVKAVQSAIAVHDSSERFEQLGVHVVAGKGEFTSKKIIKVIGADGVAELYKFKKCVIATGSRPFVPEIFASVKYETNETIWDIAKLPESMTVIGGGSVGIEIATAFANFGTKVTMVQREKRLMSKEEPQVGDFMRATLETMGVKIYTNTNIKNVTYNEESQVKVVFDLLDDKGNVMREERVLSEVIFVSTGRKYNTALGLEAAKVSYSGKGIEINDYLETSNKKVYAIGDVNGKMLFTHAAGYQAKAVLQNMLMPKIFNFLKKKSLPEAFPWVTYTYPEVAHVGAYTRDLELKKIYYKQYITKLESVDRARTSETHEDGYIQILVGKKSKILGVTIVSPMAGELITEWTLAMQHGLPVEAIYNTVHAYPTLSELNPRGTFEHMQQKLNSPFIFILKYLFKIF